MFCALADFGSSSCSRMSARAIREGVMLLAGGGSGSLFRRNEFGTQLTYWRVQIKYETLSVELFFASCTVPAGKISASPFSSGYDCSCIRKMICPLSTTMYSSCGCECLE